MAQTFSYKYIRHLPLPKGMADEANQGQSLFVLSCTGPASSVQAGMTIASLSTDLTYISECWMGSGGAAGYKPRFDLGTANVVADFKIALDRVSTGTALSDSVSLTGHNFRIIGLGSGPFASAID